MQKVITSLFCVILVGTMPAIADTNAPVSIEKTFTHTPSPRDYKALKIALEKPLTDYHQEYLWFHSLIESPYGPFYRPLTYQRSYPDESFHFRYVDHTYIHFRNFFLNRLKIIIEEIPIPKEYIEDFSPPIDYERPGGRNFSYWDMIKPVHNYAMDPYVWNYPMD